GHRYRKARTFFFPPEGRDRRWARLPAGANAAAGALAGLVSRCCKCATKIKNAQRFGGASRQFICLCGIMESIAQTQAHDLTRASVPAAAAPRVPPESCPRLLIPMPPPG